MVPYFERDGVTLYHGRCENVLPTLESGSIDLILTDPPYFRVKDEWWDRQWDSADGFLSWLGGLCVEWKRVLKPNGSLYCFASPRMAARVELVIGQHFNVLNRIRWTKRDGWHQKAERESLRAFLSPWEEIVFAEQRGEGGSPLGDAIRRARETAGMRGTDLDVALGYVRKKNPARGTELCRRWEEGSSIPTEDDYCRSLAACGDRRDRDALRREYDALRRPFAASEESPATDVWDFPTVQDYPGKHPCEKPLAMMHHIISVSTRPGAVVLDGFAGSGSSLVAAVEAGRSAIGIEVEERWCRRTAARISQGVLNF